jgi:hypothetical protein
MCNEEASTWNFLSRNCGTTWWRKRNRLKHVLVNINYRYKKYIAPICKSIHKGHLIWNVSFIVWCDYKKSTGNLRNIQRLWLQHHTKMKNILNNEQLIYKFLSSSCSYINIIRLLPYKYLIINVFFKWMKGNVLHYPTDALIY